MSGQTLEQKLQAAGGAVQMARNSQIGAYVPVVPPEFSNWRDESLAWRETAALLDLTHHMTDLSVEGPDALRLFSDLGVNSFANFPVNTAKQFVCCNPNGYFIGDGILFHLNENRLSLLGLPMAHNWVQYRAQSGGYKVNVERDDPTGANRGGKRKLYRLQVQGPLALQVLGRATGGCAPEIKFFKIGELKIAGHPVRALRHGMAGAPGLELFGPWEERDEIVSAINEAGLEFGLRQVGSKAYQATTLESGWIPGPLPAIFTGPELAPYRSWLLADSYEGMGSLGGSFYSEEITDYYLTPHELGYSPFIKFDHDFVGRRALEAMGDKPHRKKVTLVWNADDVTAVMRALFRKGDIAKYINLPWSDYATWQYDKVVRNGALVGLSTSCGYSYNERALLSLAMVNAEIPFGTTVTVVWGEEGGGSRRPVVERHVQFEIRAELRPCPYSQAVRTSYAIGWRTKASESRASQGPL